MISQFTPTSPISNMQTFLSDVMVIQGMTFFFCNIWYKHVDVSCTMCHTIFCQYTIGLGQTVVKRRVWRYQDIEEEQTTQWTKEKVQKDNDLQNIHIKLKIE